MTANHNHRCRRVPRTALTVREPGHISLSDSLGHAVCLPEFASIAVHIHARDVSVVPPRDLRGTTRLSLQYPHSEQHRTECQETPNHCVSGRTVPFPI